MNKPITYRFESHPKQKGRCPKCGRQGKFRYFENSLTGDRLSQEYGKCERINSCGYFNLPEQAPISPALKDHLIKPAIKQKYVDYLTAEQSLRHYHKNNFTKWLKIAFGNDNVTKVIERYHIGTGEMNSTIFWLVDMNQDICNGKKIVFDHSGHRNRSINPQHLFKASEGYKTCLFGEHLLANANDKSIICLVESEKTAIICSIYWPDQIWMASGGANGLTTEKAIALKGRNILLVPDQDQAGRKGFQDKIETLKLLSCKVELLDIDPQRNDGKDIADFIEISNNNLSHE